MHNVLTPRGAPVRDALRWSKYMGEAIELFGALSDVHVRPAPLAALG